MVKPLLAAESKLPIRFPVYASFKIDGIRILVKDGFALSRSLKPIPNQEFQSYFNSFPELHGLDGEAVCGPANDPNVMQETTSGLMSHNGTPDWRLYVFDYWTQPNVPFKDRYKALSDFFVEVHPEEVKEYPTHHRIKLLPHIIINNQDELDAFEAKALAAGYEGIMVRDPGGPYKYGRSTDKQGILLKIKRFLQSEAIILGAEEKMHNENEAELDNLGYTVRSTAKDGMVPAGTLGALVCKDLKSLVEFNVGSGFDDKTRAEFWQLHQAGQLRGKIITYRYFEIGVKEKPRFPTFISIRDPSDMDPQEEDGILVLSSDLAKCEDSVLQPAMWKKSTSVPPVTCSMSVADQVDHIRKYYDIPDSTIDNFLNDVEEMAFRITSLEK